MKKTKDLKGNFRA